MSRRPTIVRPPRAFTLVEILVAVAALSILGVGLALVFKAAGDTVSAGNRLSYLNRQARLLERRLREDFSNITRDGYLVIRNEWVQADHSLSMTGDGLPDEGDDDNKAFLFDGQEPDRKRHRRVDEIMFFARDRFRSAREAIHPSVVAESSTARIRYGHAQPRRPSEDLPAYVLAESPDAEVLELGNFDADATFGFDDPLEENRNRFASNWILARHVTLLAEPGAITKTSPQELTGSPFNLDPDELPDSKNQVALQPAATTIFRAPASGWPFSELGGIREDMDKVYPRFESGLIDIATTDLASVRAVVSGPPCAEGSAPCDTPLFPGNIASPSGYAQWQKSVFKGAFGASFLVTDAPDVLDAMHAWMLDGLPTYSFAPEAEDRIRIRVEPAAPDYTGVITDAIEGDDNALDQSIRRADQLMLSASNLVPGCTEFIVEWSFGNTYPDDFPVESLRGRTVWHGLKRFTDLDADGDADDDELIAVPYDASDSFYADKWNEIRGEVPVRWTSDVFTGYPVGGVPANSPFAFPGRELIHGSNFTNDIKDGQLLSFFGFRDPTFDPTDVDGDGVLNAADDDADGNGVSDGNQTGNFGQGPPLGEPVTDTIPWAWPRLIRITVSLVDPADPGVEETFQFVLRMPAEDGN